MSGHSKWATIKHKKAAIDKVRGNTFAKLSRLLEVAAREGGGDVTTNAALRTVVAKAKSASMTNDAIDRAIKRGMGETDGKAYESVTYEAYAPGGVAMLIDILTDNRNRTAADVRIIFFKAGWLNGGSWFSGLAVLTKGSNSRWQVGKRRRVDDGWFRPRT